MTSPPASVVDSVDVQRHGDHATLVFRRFFRHPPSKVWAAITEPEQLRGWLLTDAKIDGRVGGSVEMVTTTYRVAATGEVLAWEPPRLFEHTWIVPPGPNLPGGERAVVRWELAPSGDGTILTLTHEGLTERTATGYRVGLQAFLDRLAAQLAGEPLPEWEGRIRELRGETSVWG